MHLATDWDDYADQMRAALVAEPRLQVQVDRAGATSGTAPLWRSARPLRPVTAYERRGHDAGRTITDLVAHRR
jgi:tRNA (guanine-N7-)-methyltransferase